VSGVRGLPERLPAGERLLWQGAPEWRLVARRVLHVRKLALYFALIVVWVGGSSIQGGAPTIDTARSVLRAVALASVPLAGLMLYAWAISRSTVYTLTDKRLVLRTGLALPLTINIPFARIEAAAVAAKPDGSGDISVSLIGKDRLAYLVLWPHARPWRLARAEPSFRALADVQKVAQMLARALAASAEMPVPVLHEQADAASVGAAAQIAA